VAPTGNLHLNQLNYLAELIDRTPASWSGAPGEGELVLTMLVDGIKPLVRYRTADLVRISPVVPGSRPARPGDRGHRPGGGPDSAG